MDQVLPAHAATLQTNLRQYLSDLAEPHDIWLAGDWERDTYFEPMARMLSNICSSCQYDPNDVGAGSLTVDSGGELNAVALDAIVNGLHLPASVLACLNAPGRRRSVWVDVT